MSGPTTAAGTPSEHGTHGGAHPSDAQYVKIALILAVVTAVEVGLYYTDLGVNVTNGMLMVLAIVKFAMVAAYFMHLRFDSHILRRLFLTGLVLALVIYVLTLLTFGVFIDPPPQQHGLASFSSG
ncbi:MAG: cytochrome C oxidase subunit IV family protein [Acidimicrobiales bacterium]